MADEILYTLLKDACSGDGVHDVFVVAAVHPEDFPLDTVSLLVHVDLSQNPPSIRTLLNARQEIDDEEDCSSFECLTRDGEVLYIGNSGGDGIAYAHGEVTRLAFKLLRPRPGGTYSACRLGTGHVLFGTFAGVIVDFQSGQVAAHRVFEDGSYLSVNALQSLGDDFVIAVGGNGCVSRFDGSNWYAVDTPTRDRFLGVWCRSRTDVYFAAEALWHWDGAQGWKCYETEHLDFSHLDDVPSDLALCICDVAEYQGVVYVAAGVHGMLRVEGDRLVLVDIGVRGAVIGRLRLTSAGLIGVGAWGEGGGWLVHWDGDRWRSAKMDLSHAYGE